MTNKLPEIGKRYRKKTNNLEIEIFGFLSDSDLICYKDLDCSFECYGLIKPHCLKSKFEELPDQEPKPDISKMETTDKVKEALKELKKDLADFGEGLLDDDVDGEGFDIYISAMELVNALESNMHTKLNNMSLVNQTTQETTVSSIVEHTRKSIWKPISEYQKTEGSVLAKGDDGTIYIGHNWFNAEINKQQFETLNNNVFTTNHSIIEYCQLTDFINQQENLEERITKLENKM